MNNGLIFAGRLWQTRLFAAESGRHPIAPEGCAKLGRGDSCSTMELLIWTALCALIGLGCLGGAAFAIVGAEDVGVERIFLVLVWLFFAALFLGLAAWIVRLGALSSLKKKAKAAPDASAPESKPEQASKAAS